jgi:hypothetical protein
MRNVRKYIALLGFLGACVSTNSVMLGGGSHFAPVPAPEVRVFLTKEDVKGPYDEIALINASGASSWTNESQMVRAMQKKAGALGANAIILGDIKEPSSGAKVAAAIFGMDTTRKGKVVAIRLRSVEVP